MSCALIVHYRFSAECIVSLIFIRSLAEWSIETEHGGVSSVEVWWGPYFGQLDVKRVGYYCITGKLNLNDKDQ